MGEFFSVRTDYFSLPDIISNIFLYVPLGLLLYAFFRRGRRPAWIALVGSIICASVLSFAIEWAQVYSPTRVSSLLDLCSNILGASIGAVISLLAGWMLPKLVGAALYEFHARPQVAAIKTYCLLLVVFGVMPFSFSLDVGRMKESYKRANFVPFANATFAEAGYGGGLRSSVPTGRTKLAQGFNKWAVMKSWSRWGVELLSFAVLVWLFVPLLRDHYGFDGKALWGLIWWISGLMAIGISGLQFFVVHRGLDTTDVVFRMIGVAVGLLSWSLWMKDSGRWDDQRRAHVWRKLAWGTAAATLMYIIYTGIIPATFDDRADGPAKSMASTNFLPFFAYFMTRVDVMMDDLLEKAATYTILGASLSICWTRAARSVSASNMWPVTIVAVLLSCGIEAIQMFIPVRVTSLTDPIIAGTGCAVGVMIRDRAAVFFTFAQAHDMYGPDRALADAAHLGRAVTPDDILATLAESHPRAPKERFRGRQRRTRRD